MKLKTKLITPILGLGAIAATVVPLTVSCKGQTTKNTFDGTEIYVPVTAKAVTDEAHKESGYTIDGAKELYFNDLAQDPQVLIDDIFLQVSTALYTGKINSKVIYGDNAIIEQLVDGKISLNYSDFSVNKDNFTVSFKVKGSCDFESWPEEEATTKAKVGSFKVKLDSFECTFNQMPYICEQRTSSVRDYPYWSFIWNNLRSTDVTPFSMTLKANGYVGAYQTPTKMYMGTYNGEERTINKDNITEISKLQGDTYWLMEVMELFTQTSNSYHLSNIKYDSGE